MTVSQLRAATMKASAVTPVLVEVELNGERRPVNGWRLEGNPRGNPPTPHLLILELGRYINDGEDNQQC